MAKQGKGTASEKQNLNIKNKRNHKKGFKASAAIRQKVPKEVEDPSYSDSVCILTFWSEVRAGQC